MSPARTAKALVAAIASAIAVLAAASGTEPATSSRLRPLAGTWRLREGASPAGTAAGSAAPRSLRIDVDGPLVSLTEPGREPRSFWVGGPPGQAREGAARETLLVEPGSAERLVRTVSQSTGGSRAALRLVYERERAVPGGGSFPTLPAAAAVVALALVALAEGGLAGRLPPRAGPACRKPGTTRWRSAPGGG